ncbi:hypothetical protein SMD44_06945 [Streptomyces alboflavus]|uniref:Uncharacterized protein n=1 Tax=Streptomyces alboflavus TaxID=67267 RepID=A0A1Z1WLZ4_9ACTN|nr:hypothetical protein SMD44_06945 [Streptomyces alboflavus]
MANGLCLAVVSPDLRAAVAHTIAATAVEPTPSVERHGPVRTDARRR